LAKSGYAVFYLTLWSERQKLTVDTVLTTYLIYTNAFSDRNILLAQIWATSGFHAYQMWAGSGLTLCCCFGYFMSI